jgi:hypothetical protein
MNVLPLLYVALGSMSLEPSNRRRMRYSPPTADAAWSSAVGHFRQIDPLPTLSACPLCSDRVRTFAPQRFDEKCQERTNALQHSESYFGTDGIAEEWWSTMSQASPRFTKVKL